MITRKQFEAMEVKYGGDFWNQWKRLSAAFKEPAVQAIQLKTLSTGLFSDCRVLVNNAWIERRHTQC